MIDVTITQQGAWYYLMLDEYVYRIYTDHKRAKSHATLLKLIIKRGATN